MLKTGSNCPGSRITAKKKWIDQLREQMKQRIYVFHIKIGQNQKRLTLVQNAARSCSSTPSSFSTASTASVQLVADNPLAATVAAAAPLPAVAARAFLTETRSGPLGLESSRAWLDDITVRRWGEIWTTALPLPPKLAHSGCWRKMNAEKHFCSLQTLSSAEL